MCGSRRGGPKSAVFSFPQAPGSDDFTCYNVHGAEEPAT